MISLGDWVCVGDCVSISVDVGVYNIPCFAFVIARSCGVFED
jgi:hypothetical protein